MFSSEASCGIAERRLLNDLMEYYQKLERPVANESDAVQLKARRLETDIQLTFNILGKYYFLTFFSV